MSQPPDLEARLAALGARVDANRSAINALGQQTAAGFTEMRSTFTEIRSTFTEMRGTLDQAAAGQAQIADMLSTLIARQDEQ